MLAEVLLILSCIFFTAVNFAWRYKLNQRQKQLEDKASKIDQWYLDILNSRTSDLRAIDEIINSAEERLESLVQTEKAAKAVLLKQKEQRDRIDDYRLIPSDSELIEIKELEEIKKELRKPRVLSMLIWQTFWQPLAKVKFPIILQDKTKMGIYKITNIKTQECYVGQSVDIYKRWCEHCKAGLGIDTPPGNKLYKAIQSEGLENFIFELLSQCKQNELNERERYFIKLFQADTYGYNSNVGIKK